MSESFFSANILHRFKGICGGLAEDTLGGEVAPYWSAYKVMRSCIANVLNDCRIYITQINETLGQGGACQSRGRQHHDYQDKASTDEHLAALCVWHRILFAVEAHRDTMFGLRPFHRTISRGCRTIRAH